MWPNLKSWSSGKVGEGQDNASTESHLVCSFTITFLTWNFAHHFCLEQHLTECAIWGPTQTGCEKEGVFTWQQSGVQCVCCAPFGRRAWSAVWGFSFLISKALDCPLLTSCGICARCILNILVLFLIQAAIHLPVRLLYFCILKWPNPRQKKKNPLVTMRPGCGSFVKFSKPLGFLCSSKVWGEGGERRQESPREGDGVRRSVHCGTAE